MLGEPASKGERYEEDIGELSQTVGISYQIAPQWAVGLEKTQAGRKR